jgi:membrane-associated phospholipid phosphatase
MSQHMWISITDLGDSAVGLTLALLVLIAMVASGWTRGAVAWLATVAGCGVAIAVFKITSSAVSQNCGVDASAAAVFSPSGHAALSTVVYGGLAVLGGRRMSFGAQLCLGAASAVLVALIATSRVAIHAHTPVEVATGLAVGLSAVALLVYLLQHRAAPPLLAPQLALACAIALVWMYGTHWPVEQTLHRWANWIRQSTAVCGH